MISQLMYVPITIAKMVANVCQLITVVLVVVHLGSQVITDSSSS